MDINVKEIREATGEHNEARSIGRTRPFNVGDTIYIPFTITEINAKMTGDTVLKQIRIDGPAINPSQETYTEHRLREVFEAV